MWPQLVSVTAEPQGAKHMPLSALNKIKAG